MKVIFLDFDGVINNWNHFDGVDVNNLLYLKTIIERTGAKIVATTSNKYDFQVHGINYEDTKYFQYIKTLNVHGIDVFDVTPYIMGHRESEINKYLEIHEEIKDFVILDDNYVGDSLREHQVFLDLYYGITSEHVLPAIDILNGKLGFYPPEFDFNETDEERWIRINKYHNRNK